MLRMSLFATQLSQGVIIRFFPSSPYLFFVIGLICVCFL